jgi:hypothetical protein
MADAKEILQFGIEAARDGNREEARNLFTLLTKQDPNNIQAWLWLAGVSDTPTQRRNALERALQIDPHNEMALRGLRALDGERQSSSNRGRGVLNTARERTGSFFGRQSATPASSAGRASRPATQLTSEEEELTEALETFDDEYADNEGRGPSPLMWGVLGTVFLLLVVFLATQIWGTDINIGGISTGSLLAPSQAEETTAVAATVESMATASPRATMTPAITETPTAVPVVVVSEADTLTDSGWTYGVRSPLVAGDRTARLGDVPPTNGRYFVVVVVVANSSGTTQAIPASFFVLSDDQGRVYNVNVERTNMLMNIGGGRGVVSDIIVEDTIPSGPALLSMALIFDVHADATNLKLYGGNTRSQGWLIASSVQ